MLQVPISRVWNGVSSLSLWSCFLSRKGRSSDVFVLFVTTLSSLLVGCDCAATADWPHFLCHGSPPLPIPNHAICYAVQARQAGRRGFLLRVSRLPDEFTNQLANCILLIGDSSCLSQRSRRLKNCITELKIWSGKENCPVSFRSGYFSTGCLYSPAPLPHLDLPPATEYLCW